MSMKVDIAIGVLALFVSGSSGAALITFDEIFQNTDRPTTVDGFEFDYLNENGWCICDPSVGSAQIGNGTSQILVRNSIGRDASITMSDTSDLGLFSIQSFLGADGLLGVGGRTIEVIGFLFGGGTVVQSFVTVAGTQSLYTLSSAFIGLTSVEFHSFGDLGDGLAIDNILVNSRVPEPTSVLLLGTGLLGFGLVRRKALAINFVPNG